MTYNEILSSIREQIHDISVLKNGDFLLLHKRR